MHVGIRHNSVEGYEGLIDDLFLWDDSENPLSDEDILAIASEGMSAFLGFDEDSDGDGLPDVWELENGLDPEDDGSIDPINGADGDPDGDGLSNGGEFAAGSLARNDDSDDDGLKDNDEVATGTQPANPDTDSDGLTDGDEIAGGTNPVDPDSDEDGFLDGFEVANGSNPNDAGSVPGIESLLAVHLTFDGIADDVSGNENHGEAIGDPSFDDNVPEVLGGGESLRLPDGDVDGVGLEPSDQLNSSPFTLAYFINSDGSAQGNAGLERLTSRAGDGFETAIGDANAVGGTSSETGLTLSYYQGTWNVTDVEIADNGWTHVAWRNDGDGPDDMHLFVNGALEYTGPGVPEGRLTGLLNIGIRHNGVEGYEGLMDDFRLYAGSLSDADIADLAQGAARGRAPFLIVDLERRSEAEIQSVELTWSSQPGRLYSIDYSADLSNWIEITDAERSQGQETSFSHADVSDEVEVRYYRVREN